MNHDVSIGCFDGWGLVANLPDGFADLVLIDPPYDMVLDMHALRRVCKGHIIAFCDPRYPYFRPDEQAWWIKPISTKNNQKSLSRFVEEILIERHGATFNKDLHWSNYTGVYEDRILTKQIHPFEKPLPLIERLIRIYSNPGDIVLDPFCGTGTTLLASVLHGRSSIGCEIDPQWYQVALSRLSKWNPNALPSNK